MAGVYNARMRYRLRTLLIVITLVCVWLAYHLNWIQRRRVAATWISSQASYWDDMPIQQGIIPGTAPWRLRTLGAEGVQGISVVVYKEDESRWKGELDRLFPEAKVHVYTPGPGYHGKRAK